MNTGAKIIIVDDEADIIKQLKRRLQKYSYTVYTAEDAQTALSIITVNEIDIVVADIRMPLMDGLEMMQKARELRAEVQFVFITGHGDRDTALEAVKLGAIGYHNKPVRTDELNLDIQKACEKLDALKIIERQKELIKEQQGRIDKLKTKIPAASIIPKPTMSDQELDAIIQVEEERLHKLRNIKAIKEKIKREEKELVKGEIRDAIFDILDICVRYWELCTGKSKVDMAEESKQWTVTLENSGSLRVKTLENYLKHPSIPENPNYSAVLNTGEFVIQKCDDAYPELKNKLRNRMNDLENLRRKI